MGLRAKCGRPTGTETPSGFFCDDLPYEEDLRAQIAVQVAIERGRGLMLEEIGGLLGVGKERARQIEARALQRLREWAERNGQQEELRAVLAGAVNRDTTWDEISRCAPGYTQEERLRSPQRRALNKAAAKARKVRAA
jgi:hypothetical protein